MSESLIIIMTVGRQYVTINILQFANFLQTLILAYAGTIP